ncbi:hypothetical protein F0562_014777 [Nyssa sinensis]|uniref:AT-hook motif nuclear-localized protein n=1 Tax=Nyssa sinensis TaxID=561372 RepID=A0A5J4ZTT7_9ASTE|nr:hypothetical protein F0562_014777 [Nyssa sinensis]
MISGVTVIGAKEPSNYHVGAKAENSTQVSGIMGLAGMMGLAVVVGKKKRGRPRKYGPDGAIARALSPMAMSSPVPPATGDCSAENQDRGWPIGSENKQQHKVGLENLGCCNENYLIQLQPWAICIMEAAGSISNVTLRQPDSSGGTLTYEGRAVVCKGLLGGQLIAASPVQVVVASFLPK